ncbi:MAG: outer membrane lipoprotein-sorting protein [Armatimonadetes bacterium]|nr:outer membrane lipoprotein-sorting protein [Armatimonadota bacterium]
MTTALLAVALITQKDPTIEDAVLIGFKSATFVTTVSGAKQSELRKINKDFAASYRFKRMKVQMKEPFKIRLSTAVDDTRIVMIINGPKKVYRIPKVNLSKREDNSKNPAKRQTTLDFGLLTKSLFDGYMDAKYVRTDRLTGEWVFDLTYKPEHGDKSRHRVWIDPERRFLTKRAWYSRRGNLRATFLYEDATKFGDIWFPKTAIVKNAENKVAGTIICTEVVVNPTLSDDLFKL